MASVLLTLFSLPVSLLPASMRALSNVSGPSALPTSSEQNATPPRQNGELPQPYEVLKRGLDRNNYLAPLLELKAREEQYLASERMRASYLELMTLLHSYVGDSVGAYSYEDQLISSNKGVGRIREMYAKDLAASPIDNFEQRGAVEAIASVADKRQVVMINEEHRTPVHRALTLRLLPLLYARGFRYFAAETLYESDTELNKRGYPTMKTGFYTADPVYADVVRTALKLGYKVIPYEHARMADCRPTPDNPELCNDERERAQAQNLVDRILKNDPQAKIFVHVGRAHNARVRTDQQFAFMGWYFREITGIEPFVIDQVRMSERRNPADEHPLYRYATRKWSMNGPTVFQSAGGDLWTDSKEVADVRVFHPRAEYLDGRPTWLRMGGLRRTHALDGKKLNLNMRGRLYTGKRPLLVQAFVAGEPLGAIPIDQFVLYPGRQIPVLMLPRDAFQIRATDESGILTGRYDVQVK
jgi:hypothetical protein